MIPLLQRGSERRSPDKMPSWPTTKRRRFVLLVIWCRGLRVAWPSMMTVKGAGRFLIFFFNHLSHFGVCANVQRTPVIVTNTSPFSFAFNKAVFVRSPKGFARRSGLRLGSRHPSIRARIGHAIQSAHIAIREEVEPANLSRGIANAVQVQMRPGSPSTSQSKRSPSFFLLKPPGLYLFIVSRRAAPPEVWRDEVALDRTSYRHEVRRMQCAE